MKKNLFFSPMVRHPPMEKSEAPRRGGLQGFFFFFCIPQRVEDADGILQMPGDGPSPPPYQVGLPLSPGLWSQPPSMSCQSLP